MASDPPERGEDAAQTGAFPDRRRPGRVRYRNPHLIALLRVRLGKLAEPTPIDEPIEDDRQPDDRDKAGDLRPALGVGTSVLIGIALWFAIIIAAVLIAVWDFIP